MLSRMLASSLFVLFSVYGSPGDAAGRRDLPEDWLATIPHIEARIDIPKYPVNVLLLPKRDTILDFANCNNKRTKPPGASIGFNDPIPFHFSYMKPGESIPHYDPEKLHALIDYQKVREDVYTRITTALAGIPAQKTTFTRSNAPISALALMSETNKAKAEDQPLPNAILHVSIRFFFNNVSADPIFSRLWMATKLTIYRLPGTRQPVRDKKLFKRIYKQQFVTSYDLRPSFQTVRDNCPNNPAQQITNALYSENGAIVKQAIDTLTADSLSLMRRYFIDDPNNIRKHKLKEEVDVYFSKRVYDQAVLSEANPELEDTTLNDNALNSLWQSITKTQARRVEKRPKYAAMLYLKRGLYYKKIQSKLVTSDKTKTVLLDKSTYYALPSSDLLILSNDIAKRLRLSALEFINQSK